MAWTAPTTRSTGDLITAGIWNTDLVDNLRYLKTQADKLDDAVVSWPTRVLETVYQNTSGKIRVVAVEISANNSIAQVVCDENSSPTSIVGKFGLAAASAVAYGTITFIVPPSHYYKVYSIGGSPAVDRWTEWDLH